MWLLVDSATPTPFATRRNGAVVASIINGCVAFAQYLLQRAVAKASCMINRPLGISTPVNGHRLVPRIFQHLLQCPSLDHAAVVVPQGLGHDGDFHALAPISLFAFRMACASLVIILSFNSSGFMCWSNSDEFLYLAQISRLLARVRLRST
ncbi:hypothetical protein D3C78_346750 [compost metagenome]